MGNLALYRKYRSADFKSVIGQEPVTTTLANAVSQGRVSHAYLFSGPKGTGKTSVARILARAVNCTGPEPRPCNRCPNCLAIIGSNLDVIEIDAASNRGIDDIRDLREKVNLAPAGAAYKVFIIDEVHMLTKEAFNALLKTLEEPPAHAIFILATTEAHKLPATIVSRTQRFDFKPIASDKQVKHLAYIATSEKLQFEVEALKLLAETSQGSFRDSISLLDQAASSGLDINVENIRQLLGLSEEQSVQKLALHVANGQTHEALALVEELTMAGSDPATLTRQLIDRLRSALRLSIDNAMHDQAEDVTSLAALGPTRLSQLIEALALAREQFKYSHIPQLGLEVALARYLTSRPTMAEAPAAEPAAVGATPPPAPPADARSPSSETAASPEAKKAFAATAQPSDKTAAALDLIKAKNNSLYALVRVCQLELGDGRIVASTRFSFHKDRMEEKRFRDIIETAFSTAYGQPYRLECELVAGTATPPVDPTAELVTTALEILGGEVMEP